MKDYIGQIIDLTGDNYLDPAGASYNNGTHQRAVGTITSISVHPNVESVLAGDTMADDNYAGGDIKIPLTRGKFALVDKEDFEWLNQWKWSLSGDGRNAERRIGPGHRGSIVLMHRQIMGAEKGQLIDHINQNPLDNRRVNLRFADKSINAFNSKIRSDNTSGYRGVGFNKQANKWQATIYIMGKRIHLGFYMEIDEAAKAYEGARKELSA